jgi:hypothetical protein
MADERTLFDRLFKVQERIGKISKDKTNPFFESKYADINTVLEMIKPILHEEGILFMQPLSNVDGKPAITTILIHGKESIEYTTVFPDLPKPKEGKKSNPFQDMGSAITYYRRYALISILGLEAEDIDGNITSSQPSAPRKEQPKAQSKQAESEKEIPTCSICQQPMKPQKTNPDKWFCKHTEKGVTKWGKEVWKDQKKVTG